MSRVPIQRLSPGEFQRKLHYIIEKFLTTGVLDFNETEGLHILDKIRLRDTARDLIIQELQRDQNRRPPNVAGYKKSKSSTKKRKTTIKKTKKNKKNKNNKKNKTSRRKNFIDKITNLI